MQIDPHDLDYPLIQQAFDALGVASENWPELERIYRNVIDTEFLEKAEKMNRSAEQSPIARDTVLIKRSIFSSSFQIEDLPLSIEKQGDEDNEAARQLRIAAAYYWDKADPYVELNKAMLRMLVFPVGVVFDYWDEKKKKYILEECNPKDVAFDPGARNSNDVQFMAYRYKKTGKDIRHIIENDKGKKRKEKFYNKLKDHKAFFSQAFDKTTFQPFKRYELKEIFIRTDNGWLCKTYYPDANLLLRVVKFQECPFKWGFMREKLSSVDDAVREKEIMAYGESEIDFIKEHVKAINKRRNQHSDIIEEQINPSTYVGTGAKVKASDLKRGPGSKIPCGDPSQIKERRAPTTMGLHDDIAMQKDDIETTSSVNGLYKAATSSSDRRATGAIAMLSSQGSTRIEEQIMTANKTLFSHMAKSFVKKIYRYVDDETLMKLGVNEPVIGRDHPEKEDFDYVVKVKFGSDMKRDQLFNVYMQVLQVLGQHQDVNHEYIQEITDRAVRAKIPDEMEIGKDLFNAPAPLDEASPLPQNMGVSPGI